MSTLLRLGHTDEDVRYGRAEQLAFLRDYHHPAAFPGEVRFRDDVRKRWYGWKGVAGTPVRALTATLQALGFMPYAAHDGIFGYVTQAAVRLFQEYVRTVEPPDPGGPACWPDGVVGPATRYYVDRWFAANRQCRWASTGPTADFSRWHTWLAAAAAYYRARPNGMMQRVADAATGSDSLPPAAWSFEPRVPHLIGLRRGGGELPADDLFVLLINGRSFYFGGSTDSRGRAGREAYLCEGQHHYRFSWHNIGAARRERVYRAARPAGGGVLVTRDVHGDDALTDRNRRDGFDPRPNPTINIHWNGAGRGNWSAGCQVVNGAGYLNDADVAVSCAAYAAYGERDRGRRRSADGPRLTMGAYTVLSDLLLCYTPRPSGGGRPTFRYTLLPEEALLRVPSDAPPRISERLYRLATLIG